MVQILESPEMLADKLKWLLAESSGVFLLTDENVSLHCLPHLIAACPFLETAEVIEIEPGESSKSHEIVLHIWQHLLDCGADRKSVLINLGGGVVTDLGGFVASTFKRGIKTIHLPTSLLGMVDAAIGGKTGIDYGGVKNAVGTFYTGEVLVHPAFIHTLPRPEVVSGFGEMLKTALIADRDLSHTLFEIRDLNTHDLLQYIPNCVAIKEGVVEVDPFEMNMRKKLNLGHTLGHAVESVWIQEGKLSPHGICVAIGILAETRIAQARNLCKSELIPWLDDFIIRTFDLNDLLLPDFDQLIPFISQDKKNKAGLVHMVLLMAPGNTELDVIVDWTEMETAWRDLQNKLTA